MHSLWQENIVFPQYQILKNDRKADIVYLGATLQHGVEAHFKKLQGESVMILESQTISEMPELGGMGIIKGETKKEIRDLMRLRDYIVTKDVPCDLEIVSDTCIWVHPVKLFLWMTRDLDVFEQTSVLEINENQLDIGSAYIKAKHVAKEVLPDPMFIYVFAGEHFPNLSKPYVQMRKYKDVWLVGTTETQLVGSNFFWEIGQPKKNFKKN